MMFLLNSASHVSSLLCKSCPACSCMMRIMELICFLRSETSSMKLRISAVPTCHLRGGRHTPPIARTVGPSEGATDSDVVVARDYPGSVATMRMRYIGSESLNLESK